MSKKRIILILLLVVAAFIAWRKGLFAKLLGGTSNNGGTDNAGGSEPVIHSTSDPDKFNQDLKDFVTRQSTIASKLGLTGTEKEQFFALVRNIYVWCNDDNESHWSAAVMASTARNNGFTLDQEYALSALWAMCPEGWSEEVISKTRYSELVAKLKRL